MGRSSRSTLDPRLPETLPIWRGENLRCVVGDVAKEETAAAYTRVVLDAFGRIDVMINNAGVACVKPIADHSPEEWDRVMDINVKAPLLVGPRSRPGDEAAGRGAVPQHGIDLLGHGDDGAGGLRAVEGGCGPDHPTDGGRVRPDKIRVNAVCPGTVDTPLLRQAADDSGDPAAFLAGLAAAHPIGRIASAEEIARFFQFLASDHARFFTGAVLMIDGGYSCQ